MSSQVIGAGLVGLGTIIFFYYSAWVFVTVRII